MSLATQRPSQRADQVEQSQPEIHEPEQVPINAPLVRVSPQADPFELPLLSPSIHFQRVLHRMLLKWCDDYILLDDPAERKRIALTLYPYVREVIYGFANEAGDELIKAVEQMQRLAADQHRQQQKADPFDL